MGQPNHNIDNTIVTPANFSWFATYVGESRKNNHGR